MKIHELKSMLQRQGLAPLYLITGEEAYLRDEAVRLIHAWALRTNSTPGARDKEPADDPLEASFHCEVLYGDETTADEIVLSAQEMSLFSSKRLTIVKWAEKLPTHVGEALIPYFLSPNDSTTLVFVGNKLDGRMKWVQALKAKAVVVECPLLYDAHQAPWIRQQAQRAGVRLHPHALDLLQESSSDGLYTIWNELQKLAVYMPAGASASTQDVETVRGREPETSVFELAGAIAQRDQACALRIIATNLEGGEAPLRLLGALLWQVRRIWKAKSMLAMGKTESEVSRFLGIPPFRMKEFFTHVSGWTETQLRLAHELIWQTDSALKGWGSFAPRPILDRMILALCRISRQPSQQPASGSFRTAEAQRKGRYMEEKKSKDR
ncbi:MAG: DNA polymerase III subunit delta [Nitrospirae bacterium]|nr:MAG: DNA polymerase III subunit delta [Nitrospirota bacterium]